MNFLEGAIEEGAFRHPTGTLEIQAGRHHGPVTLGFRPEHATLVESARNGALPGEVYIVEPLGHETLVTVKVGTELMNVRMPASFAPPIGASCWISLEPSNVHLFNANSGEAIKAIGLSEQSP